MNLKKFLIVVAVIGVVVFCVSIAVHLNFEEYRDISEAISMFSAGVSCFTLAFMGITTRSKGIYDNPLDKC